MSTRHKLYMSILSLVFVILTMGVATFSILSAATTYITSNLEVSYNAENIWAGVKGTYSINGGTPVNLVNSAGGTEVSFVSTDSLSTKSLSNGGTTISLSPTVTNVLFIYTFTNKNPVGGTTMTVTFADGSSKSNLTVKYLQSSSSPTLAQAQASTNTTGSFTFDVSAGSSGYVAIYMEITSIYSDASYSSATSAGIASTLASKSS